MQYSHILCKEGQNFRSFKPGQEEALKIDHGFIAVPSARHGWPKYAPLIWTQYQTDKDNDKPPEKAVMEKQDCKQLEIF